MRIQGHPAQRSEFLASQGYAAGPRLKTKTSKQNIAFTYLCVRVEGRGPPCRSLLSPFILWGLGPSVCSAPCAFSCPLICLIPSLLCVPPVCPSSASRLLIHMPLSSGRPSVRGFSVSLSVRSNSSLPCRFISLLVPLCAVHSIFPNPFLCPLFVWNPLLPLSSYLTYLFLLCI